MSDLHNLVEALAELIASKVSDKLSGTAVSLPPEASPKEGIVDKSTEEVLNEQASPTPKRKTRKKAVKEEPKEEVSEEDTEDYDMPTKDQLDRVREEVYGCDTPNEDGIIIEAYDLDDARGELLDYYVDLGHTKVEASTTVSEATDEEIREAHLDYSARILALQDGATGEDRYQYVDSPDTIYKAERLIKGDVVIVYCRSAIMLTPEQIAEEKLPAIGEEPAPAKKTRRTRKKA